MQVTTSSFTAAFSLDTAGAIYYIITNLSSSSVSVQPGTTVLVSGGFGELTPTPTAESDYTSESVTVEGGDTTLEVDFPTGRRLSGQSEDTEGAADVGAGAGVTPWHGGFPGGGSTAALPATAAMQQDWPGSVPHRCVCVCVCVCYEALVWRKVSTCTNAKQACVQLSIPSFHANKRVLHNMVILLPLPFRSGS